VFASTPVDFFGDDGAAAEAIDAPHGVQQENEKAPQRDELKTPLGELIVARCGLMAARADGGGTLARTHGDLNALLVDGESGFGGRRIPQMVATVQLCSEFSIPQQRSRIGHVSN
jgi:hypothetical protein